MKILIYKGKYDVYFDATVSEASAFLAMFKFIDGLGYYGEEWIPSYQWPLVEKARNGDKAAAYDLLRERSQHEYEGWCVSSVVVPEH